MVATGGEKCPVSSLKKFIIRIPGELHWIEKERSVVPCHQHFDQSPTFCINHEEFNNGPRKDWQNYAVRYPRSQLKQATKEWLAKRPSKTLVRKLDKLGLAEISAATGHSNINSLDSYQDAMNKRKTTEPSLAMSDVPRAVLQVENSHNSKCW